MSRQPYINAMCRYLDRHDAIIPPLPDAGHLLEQHPHAAI